MKKYLLALPLTFFFFCSSFAQLPVMFSKGNFLPDNNIQKGNFKKEILTGGLSNGFYFGLIQFSILPSATEKMLLAKQGIVLENYLPQHAYLASIAENTDFTKLTKKNIISINIVPTFFKTDVAAENYKEEKSKSAGKYFAVNFYTSAGKEKVLEALKKLGASVVKTNFDANDVIYIQPKTSILANIAALPFVSFISIQSFAARALNYDDVGTHSLASMQSITGRNLQGKNITLGVGDIADTKTHIDFFGRNIARVPVGPSFHGIHTSGTAAGGGIKIPANKGVAPKASVINAYFTDIISQTPAYITDYNLTSTNNSYTTADNGCVGNGRYDASSNFIDDQLLNFTQIMHVYAAGNDGGFNCGGFPTSFATIKSGWQCAKNVLTVGNVNGDNYLISPTSSRGPVIDGRIKPEIVADGSGKTSTIQFNNYGNSSGTSMAAPTATGTIGLLTERYKQLNGNANPSAALMKALMCNTAEDLGNPGPDYTYGFGLLNGRRAVEALEANRYFFGNSNSSIPIIIPAGARRLKVMLYWADVAAASNAATALVNDLDLTVTGASGLHLPLVLNGNAASVTNNAVEAADHLNNIEQVVIDNPTAGTHNLNVNLFNVPQGSQNYIITYQVDMNGVTVEYPFGGETLVPGETERIRWSANGDESSTYTVEYSNNNGSSWNVISANEPAGSRSLSWVVPANVTNAALVRVSKNTSALNDVSDANFSILGVPTLTATVPCEGYVELNWNTVAGASSYDVLQLGADSMEIITNTTGSSFLVKGLQAAGSYWFGVQAKNGLVNGRRSISENVVPATGSCTLSPAFDNNFKAVSVDAPVNGRAFTSSALSAAEAVRVTIKNLDDAASSGSYDLFYQINNQTVVMQTSAAIIPALASAQFTFTTAADFSTSGIYTVKSWVKRTGDTQPQDDTATSIIKSLSNGAVALPVDDGFETTINEEYTVNTIGLDGNDRLDFKTNNARGRARTFVNTGFALSGNRAITLDQNAPGGEVTDSLLATYNLSNYTAGNLLRYNFSYKNHGQENFPNNKVWIRGSDTNPWVLAYDLAANQAGIGQWKNAIININNVLDTVVPAQPITSSFQVKFGEEGITSANIPNPISDQDDGYTFDDTKLSEAINDVEVLAVVSPTKSGCGVAGPLPLQVTLKNYGAIALSNVVVSYRVNGGTQVNETINSLPAGAANNYTFSSLINFIPNTDYTIDCWISAGADNYKSNDSLLGYYLHTSEVINTFPYIEGFETGSGGFFTNGTNNNWQLGTPSKTEINKAANGTNAWVTGLSDNYNNYQTGYLYSPCFNLTGLTVPVLSFSHIYKTELDYDYNWVDYSTDGGVTWVKLGVQSQGTNWYNDVKRLWNISNAKWHVASYDLPVGAANVRFRFVFTSDAGVTDEGVGIDDIHVFDKATIYTGVNETSTNTISGSNWLDVNAPNGNKIASINPQGNNLGLTNTAVYFNTGAVRFTSVPNNQYYLNRNIVIRPATQPVTPVLVRYYFTDAEALALMNANGCGTCTSIKDPYEAGVTKYSGTAAEENGNFNDNFTGIHQFILPANVQVIPYNNGYYAEFSVNGFSEFWINNGGPGANQPLPVSLLSFNANKQEKTVRLAWKTTSEINSSHFVVERSSNGMAFEAIGNVNAKNIPGEHDYSYIDLQPLSPVNFYRLKSVDLNGKFAYSEVRKVNFENSLFAVNIYPNPVIAGVINIISSENCYKAILYDAVGTAVARYKLSGKNNLVKVTSLAKGMYQIKIFSDKEVVTEKIIIQ
ncbi:MAG: S8 family serine peptidase [Ferruginibacter sp.]